MTTTKILGEAVGVQWQSVTDQTETNPAPSLTQAIFIGRFMRGENGIMTINQNNIRGMLGHEPENPDYIAVQACLDTGVPSIQVLRVGSAGSGGEVPNPGSISCDGATDMAITTGLWFDNFTLTINDVTYYNLTADDVIANLEGLGVTAGRENDTRVYWINNTADFVRIDLKRTAREAGWGTLSVDGENTNPALSIEYDQQGNEHMTLCLAPAGSFYLIMAQNKAGTALLMQKNPEAAINLYPLDDLNLNQPLYEQGLITAPSIAAIPYPYNINFSTDDSLLGLQHVANGNRKISFFAKNTATGQYDAEATLSPPVAGWPLGNGDVQYSINHDASWIAVTNNQSQILIYQRTTRTTYTLYANTEINSFFGLAFSPDGEYIAHTTGLGIDFYDFDAGVLSNRRIYENERDPDTPYPLIVYAPVWVSNALIAVSYSWVDPNTINQPQQTTIKAFIDIVRVGAESAVVQVRDDTQLVIQDIRHSVQGYLVAQPVNMIIKINPVSGGFTQTANIDPELESYGFVVKPDGNEIVRNINHPTELGTMPVIYSVPPT